MKKNIFIIIFAYLFLPLFTQANDVTLSQRISIDSEKLDEQNTKFNITFHVKPNESIYSNSINISSDTPNIQVSSPLKQLMTLPKEVDEDFTILINVKKMDTNCIDNYLHISYMTTNDNKPVEEKIKINVSCPKAVKQVNSTLAQREVQPNKSVNDVPVKKSKKNFMYYVQQISSYTQNLIKTTTSTGARLLLVFILGILMSFTPCIYPVIPVTVGVLQMQGTKSLFYNFLLSICYALGIATTFASFGFIAALTGHLFGQILMQPIFVIFIVCILVYLALSMFGFYDMYVPQFLNSNNNVKVSGSPLSAFAFGAVSGSIASPCLSPGLALLLSIVATTANKFLGFFLLFSFGIGLSVPLILIGTFSSSMNFLPRSGMWMVEVKKLFGFLLFAMSFYYLNNILPFYIILWLIGLFLIASGIYYLKSIDEYDTKFWKYFKNIIGISLIASSIYVFTKAFQATIYKQEEVTDHNWLNNYDEAINKASKENKKLLIDIGASFCTLCKAIDKYVFNDPIIKDQLANFVLVKVDATNPDSQPYASLKEKYKVIGVPTILIIDPNSKDLAKRWEGELYDLPKDAVIQELEKIK